MAALEKLNYFFTVEMMVNTMVWFGVNAWNICNTELVLIFAVEQFDRLYMHLQGIESQRDV